MRMTAEDLERFGCLVKETAYSKPTNVITDSTQFLITATPSEEYKQEVLEGKVTEIDAKGEHYLPIFFVYESDELTLKEQLNIAQQLLASSYRDNIFSITYSGSKSLHILVYIDKEDRRRVKEDFKYYWKKIAENIFGKSIAEKMDNACASVCRLSRLPGGRRDNGKEQKCFYMNRECKGVVISKMLKSEKADIDFIRSLSMQDLERKRKLNAKKFGESDPDTVEHLERAVAKSHNATGEIALRLAQGEYVESGSNLIGAIKYAERLCGPLVASIVKAEAHRQHPTNIH